jgi:hypothetical protein
MLAIAFGTVLTPSVSNQLPDGLSSPEEISRAKEVWALISSLFGVAKPQRYQN